LGKLPNQGTAGLLGHVAFVTGVNGSQITVSQYNYHEDGNYSTQSGAPGQLGFSSFVHFEMYEVGGGTSVSRPSAIHRSSTSMDVFFRTTSESLAEDYWTSTGGWVNQSLPGGVDVG
jgi:surface antigen